MSLPWRPVGAANLIAVDVRGIFWPRRRREPTESLNPPAEEDLLQIEALRAAGSRVELPHPVRAFLLFGLEADARGFMEAVERDGARCQVRATADGRWMVTAVQLVVPTPGGITKLREGLTETAQRSGGRFLSWQAPVVR